MVPSWSASLLAAAVMTIETALAKASLDNVALRDPHATDHVTDYAALNKMTPHFDWTAYLSSADVAAGAVSFRFRDGTQRNEVPVEQAIGEIVTAVRDGVQV